MVRHGTLSARTGILRWLHLPFVILLILPVTLDARSAKYRYVSPRPGARFVATQSNIILRPEPSINVRSLGAQTPLVIGSKSGTHSLTVTISDDASTMILLPNTPFLPDETVSVHVEGCERVNECALPPIAFTFHTSTADPQLQRRVLRTQWSSEFATPAVQSPEQAARPPHALLALGCDSLPPTYPSIQLLASNNPDPGLVFIAPFDTPIGGDGHLIILDNAGVPMFYRHTPANMLDFKMQPNGLLTFFDRSGEKYYGMDSAYATIDSFETGNGYVTDQHGMQILPNGHVLLMSYDPQPVRMDTVVAGGDPNAIVTGFIVQEIDTGKNVVFEWRSWDHFDIRDGIVSSFVDLTDSLIDYCHGNAVEPDLDGNLLISSRHMNEVTKIDRQTGEIIWRLGLNAVNNDFVFPNDLRGFSHQHDIRRLPNGHITLFDNGNFLAPFQSRAVEYELDEVNMYATLVWEHHNIPELFGPFMGNVQRRASGGTTIGWGGTTPSPKVTDLHADGSTALALGLGGSTFTYRAFRFPWTTTLLSTSADTLDFGRVAMHDSTTSYVMVANTSGSPVSIDCLVHGDSSFVATADLPAVLGAGETLEVAVVFTPRALGALRDRLYIRSIQTTQLVAQAVDLFGIGDPATGVGQTAPRQTRLYPVHPNPFNPIASIRFDVATPGNVGLDIVDVRGRVVETLVDAHRDPGTFVQNWNAAGQASGVYLARLRWGTMLQSQRLVLLK